jgi:hypothetical protein
MKSSPFHTPFRFFFAFFQDLLQKEYFLPLGDLENPVPVLSIFRTNQFAVSGLLILYILLLHAASFVLEPSHVVSDTAGILWLTLCESFDLCSGGPAQFVSIMLTFIQALLINALVTQVRLYGEFNLYAGVAYVLLACLYPEFLQFSPMLVGNTFFIGAILSVVLVHRQASAADWIFNTGFWLGLASLFYPPFLFLGIWGILALSILQRRRIRERFMLLFGLLTPFIIAGSLYFFFDQLPLFIQLQFVEPYAWIQFADTNSFETYFKISLFALFILLLLFNYNSLSFKLSIQTKRILDTLYLSLLILGLGSLLHQSIDISYLLLLTPPLALLLGLVLTRLPTHWAELLHLLLLIGGLLLHFKPILFL